MPEKGGRRREVRQRKMLAIDQGLLKAACRAPGAASETETVPLALERVVRNRRFADRTRRLGGLDLVNRARIAE